MIALLLSLAAGALVVGGIGAFRLMTSSGLEDVEAQYRPEEVEEKKGFAGLLEAVGDRFLGIAVRLYGPERLRQLDVAIRRAGRPEGITVTVFLQRQAGSAVLAVAFLAIAALAEQVVVGLVVAVLLCAWMPLWLRTTARERQEVIDRELPDFLDVLGVTVKAGLGFRQAVERVCEFHDGALAQEMGRTLQEMAVGVSRRDAFVALRERTRSEGVGTFVTALLQAEELGVPLADALASIAAEVRRERAAAVRQEAARAESKMSLVVTFTILPAAVLLVVVSVLLANAESFSGLF